MQNLQKLPLDHATLYFRLFLFPTYKEPHGWAQKVLPTLMPEQKPLQCTQKAGELLFVPQGWAHATLNMGEAIAVGQQLEWLPVQREERARTVLADHSVRARSSSLAVLSHGRGSAQTRLTRAAFPACTG